MVLLVVVVMLLLLLPWCSKYFCNKQTNSTKTNMFLHTTYGYCIMRKHLGTKIQLQNTHFKQFGTDCLWLPYLLQEASRKCHIHLYGWVMLAI